MYLKNIEIKGFKSFADKINLQFDSGIAAIVGPNGSGKSNIADGVRWVLGEQSIKALRGSRMEDVIFSGTDSRKALGFAEVSVTLDNSDGFLPIEYSEIMVTRRVYRSGESEYYLNRTGCRLRDISELFMDTGIGKEGYSIIGQGRIDEILSSKAEDRRKVFEEAAGIVKYKTRKEEAERKLKRTKENLLRLGDIIEELQRQIGPLAEQSRVAKSYMEMRDELKHLELSMFVRNIEGLNRQKNGIEDRSKELQRTINDKTGTLNRFEAETSALELRAMQVEEQLNEIQDKVFKNLNLTEKKEGEIKVLKQRVQGENESIKMHAKELIRIEQDIAIIEDEKRTRESEMQDLKNKLEDKKEIMESFQANLDRIGAQVGEEEERAEEIKAEIIENLNLISEQNSRVNSLRTLNETIYKRKEQLLEEMNNTSTRMEELRDERLELKGRLDTIARDIIEITRRRGMMEQKISSLAVKREGLEREQKKLSGTLGSDKSKLVLLQQMEKEYEGYSRSVRGLIKACGSDKILSNGIIGPVAKLIEVETGLERAIETALGYSLQSIVTNTEEDAKMAIEFLKRNKLGRATFLPVSSIKLRHLSKVEEGALKMEGCMGKASSLVRCPAKVQGIVQNLLGRVIVVDSLDSGIRMARAYKYAFRIVTVDGDVINTGGSMTGGSSHSKDAGLLQRKREIGLLKKAIKNKEETAKGIESALQDLNGEEQDTERRLKDTAEAIHGLELQRIKLSEMTEAKQKEFSEKETKIKQLKTEKLELETDYSDTQNEIDRINETIKEKETENRERQETIKNLQRISSGKKQDRENIQQQITAHRVEAARIGQRLEDVQAGYRRAVSSIQRLRASKIDREKEIEINKKNILKLESAASSLRQEIESLTEENKKDNGDMVRLGQFKTECRQRMKEKKTLGMEINREISELEKKLHRYEVQLTKVDMEIESLQDRMWADYEVTRIQALDYKCEIDSEKDALSRIGELKSNIKDLGNINLNAIDEYQRVKERFDFLLTQRQDLEGARDSLLRIIKEMLDTMRKQFGEQFAVINESFGRVFRELFGGGKAQVLLADSENVLESGIDIIAQPPGKKLQHLSLLSGGEKALTAIALLFAILSVKPSPFCILDEIEAALDDSNVERFGTFLKKLSSNIQFVVITHRKGTMEIANNLYGVTMEEKGISKLVSVKLEDMVS